MKSFSDALWNLGLIVIVAALAGAGWTFQHLKILEGHGLSRLLGAERAHIINFGWHVLAFVLLVVAFLRDQRDQK